MRSKEPIGLRAPVVWGVQKRRALFWFAAAALGAWGGHALPSPVWVWIISAAASLVMLMLLRRRRDAVWGPLFLAVIALIAACATAVRKAEFERWEGHYPRGERRLMRARVVDVLPHSEGRVALLARDLEVAWALGAGPLWVRIVATADDLLRVIAGAPPGDDGVIEWPVRVYPFSPRGNPGEFDARMWAMRRGYLATAYLETPSIPPEDAAERAAPETLGEGIDPCTLSEVARRLYQAFGINSTLRETAWRWRCRLTRGRVGDTSAIALAMLLGEKDLIDPDLQEAFSRSGLGHLLAVSGLHVGFVLMLVFPLVKRMTGPPVRLVTGGPGVREWLGYSVLCGVVVGFVALTGGPASAARAGLMAMMSLGAKTLHRQVDTWQALGIAGGALLIYQPLFLLDLGFQMSFLAVAGILAMVSLRPAGRVGEARRLRLPAMKRASRFVLNSLAVTLGAQIATAPIVAFAFSSLSWVSPAVNVVAVPMGGLAVALLALGVILAELWLPLGDLAIGAGHSVLASLIAIARAVPEWGAVEVAMPSPAATAGWYGLWFGGALYARAVRHPSSPRMIRAGRAMAGAGVLLLALSTGAPVMKGVLGVAEVWVFDVGQGDSVLVRSGWGRAVLIDGGGVPGAAATGGFDVGERRVVPTLRRLGVRRLRAVINTHPHEDHVHGLAAVIRSRRVDSVYASAASSSGAAYRAFLEAAQRRGLEVGRLAVGETLMLEPGLTLTVLAGGDLAEWSRADDLRRTPSLNDRSIALLLQHKGGRMLFLGDLEERGQLRLISQASRAEELSLSDIDVLLLPHHGDRATAVSGILAVSDPRVAIVSVGPNRYGHPSAELLDELTTREVRVLRTDRHGAVNVQFWPWGIRVTGLRSAPSKGGRP